MKTIKWLIAITSGLFTMYFLFSFVNHLIHSIAGEFTGVIHGLVVLVLWMFAFSTVCGISIAIGGFITFIVVHTFGLDE